MVNCLFFDEKFGILTEIIKNLSQRAQKHTSYISRRRTKDDDTSIDGSGYALYRSSSPLPSAQLNNKWLLRRKK